MPNTAPEAKSAPVGLNGWTPSAYPPARRSDRVNVYKSAKQGEVRIPDPYDWLEDANGAETNAWTDAQAAYTRAWLDRNPDRPKLEAAIRANTDYARFSAPNLKHDGRWYWYFNSGLQPQSIIYRSKDNTLPQFSESAANKGPGGEVFFDLNLLADDGTAALATTAFSRSGEYFAYGISRSGSDFCTVYVRRTDAPLAQGKDGKRPSHDDARLPDEVRFVKFSSITWTHDSKGFFYQRFPDRASHGEASSDLAGTEIDDDKNAMLYYHRIGTSQAEDVLVMKDAEHPDWMWSTGVSEVDGRYLELYVSRDTARKNMLWIADLEENEIGQNMKWTKLFSDYDAAYEVVANDGTTMYIKTNKDAPQYKLIAVDLADKDKKIRDVIPEDSSALLKSTTALQDGKLAVVYQRNVKDELYIYDLASGKKLERLAHDFVGSMDVSGRRTNQKEVFVTMTGFTTPLTVTKFDPSRPEGQRTLDVWRSTVLKGLSTDEFSAEQVWYESKDGTKIPMFIVRHKDTPTDGTAPAIQYGYGGFSISITPSFSPSVMTFIKAYGGVYAVANIRGGGEFGEEWHMAGALERKHNCFDDFIAATDYLVSNKIAGKGKVAINGGSNGGLLVAACVNRAPEGTIGAAVAEVGVLDLLKFHKFTIGRAWTSDYGNPDDPHDFDFIYPLSPLHNVPTDRVLPPTILLTADHDDRVVPLHSFKHAATLQHTLAHNPNPLLIRIEKKAGHGAGKSTDQRVKEQADKWGFVAQSLGLKWKGD